LKLLEISKLIDASLIGNPNYEIDSISSPENPGINSIVFISTKKNLSKKLLSAGAILTDSNLAKLIKNTNILISDTPKLTFARLTNLFNSPSSKPIFDNIDGIFLGENVIYGSNFSFGNGVVIEDNVQIGKNVSISHNVVIHKNVIIGDNVKIGAGTIIGSDGFGNVRNKSNEWNHIAHLGSVEIKNNVSIGANCSIDRGTLENTILGFGVILDNQIHIAHNVIIGENTAIAAKVGIAGSCNIGKRNMIGGMVGIVDHITTADDVVISATSTVNKDIKESGVYTGIMPITKHSNWKRIALWITKLDKIAKLLKIQKI